MIHLTQECEIRITQTDEHTKADPQKWYQVIGIMTRKYQKEGKTEQADLIMYINNDQEIAGVFPSKCKIRRKDITV